MREDGTDDKSTSLILDVVYKHELYPKEIFLFSVVTMSDYITDASFLKHSMGKTNGACSWVSTPFIWT